MLHPVPEAWAIRQIPEQSRQIQDSWQLCCMHGSTGQRETKECPVLLQRQMHKRAFPKHSVTTYRRCGHVAYVAAMAFKLATQRDLVDGLAETGTAVIVH